MFCPGCGIESLQKTNYCKRCGEDLSSVGSTEAPKRTQPNMASMFWSVVTFSLSAMIVLTSLLLYFQSRGGWSWSKRYVPLLVGLGFTLVIAIMLIWQLARMITASRSTGEKVIVEKHFIREFPPVQLAAPTDQMPQPVSPQSVVEHTTRKFATLYGDSRVEEKAVTP